MLACEISCSLELVGRHGIAAYFAPFCVRRRPTDPCYVSFMGRERSFPVLPWRPSAITRRFFLQGLISSFAASQLSGFARALPAPGYPFVEVPGSSSKITWVHNAGKSALKHLPEISGAGCAFLDYDNDGWMDIYLVNSGKADFYTPTAPLRNALYHNNRDGTFTDVTDRAGVGSGLWHGRRCRRLRQ